MPDTTPEPGRTLALEEAAAHLEARAAAHTEGLDDLAGFVAKARMVEARHWNEAAQELRALAVGTTPGTSDRTETGVAIATAQIGAGAVEDGTDWAALDQVGHDTPGCDCGHNAMGAGWHANDCAWKAGMVAPAPADPDEGSGKPERAAEGSSKPGDDLNPAPSDLTLREAIAGALAEQFTTPGRHNKPVVDRLDTGMTVVFTATDGGNATRSVTPHEAADAVLAAIQPALDELADYRNRITWETNCGEHARLLDSSYAETTRRETAEAGITAVRELHQYIKKDGTCDECVEFSNERHTTYETWPCATIRELDAALTPPADQPTPGATP